MKLSKFLLIVALASHLAAAQGLIIESRLTSDMPLGRLFDKADAVVVGTIERVVAPGQTFNVSVRVDRTVKGMLKQSEHIFVELQIDGGKQIEAGTVTALWFLTGNPQRWSALPMISASSYEFADFYLRLQEGTSVERFGPPEALTPLERFASELAAAIDISGDPRLAARMPSLGEGTPSPVLASIYRTYSDSPSMERRALGIAGLIASDDASLKREGILRLAASRDIRWSASMEAGTLADTLCLSRAVDAESVTALGATIVKDSPTRMAKCAAYALRAVHTREALPYFVSLLDHPSSDMRYEGVVGLASFANNLPVHNPKSSTATQDWLTPLSGEAPFSTAETREHFPFIPAFKEQETKYINFWKVWWTRNGDAVMSGKK